MIIFRRKSKMESDKQILSLDKLLEELLKKGVDLPVEGTEAVICNDGVVLFDINHKGAGICMVKNQRAIDFNLNLTEEEMQEFNGGKELGERYIRNRRA